ncbi:MAG: hypothetical protein V4494_00225 [Chlamydiota bacterium]
MKVLFFLLLLAGCGYSFQEKENPLAGRTITVPYIEGDFEGKFTDELIRGLAASGAFRPLQKDGDLLLKVKVISIVNTKIGYRHHRDDTTGRIRKRLMPTEDRRIIKAEIMLIDQISGAVLIGPEMVIASAEYDYVDPDSIRELGFIDAEGRPRVVLDFSLGQLDSIEGAQDDVNTPLFRLLSQKIIDGILYEKS